MGRLSAVMMLDASIGAETVSLQPVAPIPDFAHN
jgi:hypothetical protein